LLQLKIRDKLFGPGQYHGEDVLLYERRHRDSLIIAAHAIKRFIAGVDDRLEAEFLALELRDAVAALGAVSGDSVTEEVLGQIFSKFCIGK
jgi:tRNA modification GTPase